MEKIVECWNQKAKLDYTSMQTAAALDHSWITGRNHLSNIMKYSLLTFHSTF